MIDQVNEACKKYGARTRLAVYVYSIIHVGQCRYRLKFSFEKQQATFLLITIFVASYATSIRAPCVLHVWLHSCASGCRASLRQQSGILFFVARSLWKVYRLY